MRKGGVNMKQSERTLLSTLLCAALAVSGALPALAEDVEPIQINEDLSVSGDYDWTRFAEDHITLQL